MSVYDGDEYLGDAEIASDTSSDDATLAAAEKWLDTLSYITLGDGDDHVRDVVAIARRLQGELLELESDKHFDIIGRLEAELRELRATIARLQPTVDLYTIRKD